MLSLEDTLRTYEASYAMVGGMKETQNMVNFSL